MSSVVEQASANLSARCCIAGGGPAGMMLGFLLARAGVDVIVLEKHADFLRDFRGDTVHPSTLEVIYELGLIDEFLKRPHQEVTRLAGQIGDDKVAIADFSHLPTHCRFIALMPQWDFLDFLADQGARYPGFRLRMQTEATDLIEESGRVIGVRAKTAAGVIEIRAGLVVGADGRHSRVRERAGLDVQDFGSPMDVFWMRLPRRPDDTAQPLGHVEAGRIFVMLNRGDYWQCALVIRKGRADEIRQQGLANFRDIVGQMVPFARDRLDELRDWSEIKLLTVTVDRLRRWYRPGLLCIGDAAHAMSPIGGVGINLAVQDAVAAANILARPLLGEGATVDDLHKVQKRRELPTRITQRLQVIIQNRIISRVLASTQRPVAPFAIKLLGRCPLLQRIPARMVGVGFRPEHVRTPAISAQDQ